MTRFLMRESSRLIAYRLRRACVVDTGGHIVLARLHTLETTPEEYEAGLRIVRDDLLPWARESTGFCGVIGLVDRESGKSLVLTLWADEDALAASADSADRLSALAADAAGARREPIASFEVSIFEVPGPAEIG
jgi:heme-degrading monooxygenase HmoA